MITERQQKILNLLKEIAAENNALLEEIGNYGHIALDITNALYTIQTNVLAWPAMKEIGWSETLMS